MSAELFRQLRRVEAQAEKGFEGKPAERADRRRRLRLELLRQHLTSNVDFLRAAHLGGASGQQSVQAYAAFMDGFLATLYRLAAEDAKREGATPAPDRPRGARRIRARRAPSAVRSRPHGHLRRRDGPVRPARRPRGCSTRSGTWGSRSATRCGACPTAWPWRGRTLPAARRCSRRGILVGDRRLFNRFRKVLAENVYQKDFAQFLETTLAERDQRYRKFGGSPYMGEPNVKESAGGLRDIHTAMWLASTKFGTRTLRELARQAAHHRARAEDHRRGADLPVARAQRAALPVRAQERRALAGHPAPDREELRLHERRGLPRRSRSSCATTTSTRG